MPEPPKSVDANGIRWVGDVVEGKLSVKDALDLDRAKAPDPQE